jgi:signal transduction histidine kinase
VSSEGSGLNLPDAQTFTAALRDEEGLVIARLPSGEVIAATRLGARASRAWLVVMRPTDAVEADVAAERFAVLVSIATLVLVIAIVTWAVLRQRVHAPLARIHGVLQRLATGDLEARLAPRRTDELGELGREINLLGEALGRARAELIEASEARERLELEMQRANRLALVGELAATLAHEIGSPLLVLNGRARDLASRDGLPAEARRSAEILVEQTERVHRIVERLLGVARRRAPQLASVELRAVTSQVLELLGPQARRADVSLSLTAASAPTLRADGAQIQQILLNLLQNSIRACHPGGRVSVQLGPATGRDEAAWVRLTVEDDGVGVPHHLREEVFRPFHTSWSSGSGDEAQHREGTGLGLAVVRSLVQDHGGVVALEGRDPARGTRVIIDLPVAGPEPGGTS